MNIFDQYLDKIKNILLDLSKNGNIVLPEKMDGITAEIPPAKFIVIFQQMLRWYYQKQIINHHQI